MKHLPASIDAQRAQTTIERALSWKIDGALARLIPSFRPLLKTVSPLPHLELVWMPQYLFRYALEGPRAPDFIAVTVDGFTLQFAVFLALPQVRDEVLSGEQPAPLESRDHAEYTAREGILKWLLMYQRNRKITMGPQISADILRYPYWVYYYQRRRGLLDVRVLDAVTGNRPGSKAKLAIIRAFQRASETKGKGQT